MVKARLVGRLVFLALCGALATAFSVPPLITPQPEPSYSDFYSCSGNGKYLFAATKYPEGRELFILEDQKGVVTLVELYPGFQSSNPEHFLALPNGYVIFVATNANNGTELWASDCTVAGTRLLYDGTPGPNSTIEADQILNPLLVSSTEAAVPLKLPSGDIIIFTNGSDFLVTPVGTLISRAGMVGAPGPIGCLGRLFVIDPDSGLTQINQSMASLFELGVPSNYSGSQLACAKENDLLIVALLETSTLVLVSHNNTAVIVGVTDYAFEVSFNHTVFFYYETNTTLRSVDKATLQLNVFTDTIALYPYSPPFEAGGKLYFQTIPIVGENLTLISLDSAGVWTPGILTPSNVPFKALPFAAPFGDTIGLLAYDPYGPVYALNTQNELTLWSQQASAACLSPSYEFFTTRIIDFTAAAEPSLLWEAFTPANGVHLQQFAPNGAASLVLDLTPGPDLVFWDNEVAVSSESDGFVYFSFWRSDIGSEIWRTDGVQTSLVQDLAPGCASSYPQLTTATNFNGSLFFVDRIGSTYELRQVNSSSPTAGVIYSTSRSLSTSPSGTCAGMFYYLEQGENPTIESSLHVFTVPGDEGAPSPLIGQYSDSLFGNTLCTSDGVFVFASFDTNIPYYYPGDLMAIGVPAAYFSPPRSFAELGGMYILASRPGFTSPPTLVQFDPSSSTWEILQEFGGSDFLEVINLNTSYVLVRDAPNGKLSLWAPNNISIPLVWLFEDPNYSYPIAATFVLREGRGVMVARMSSSSIGDATIISINFENNTVTAQNPYNLFPGFLQAVSKPLSGNRVLTRAGGRDESTSGFWVTDFEGYSTKLIHATYWGGTAVVGKQAVFTGTHGYFSGIYSMVLCDTSNDCPARTNSTCNMQCTLQGYCGYSVYCPSLDCDVSSGTCIPPAPVSPPPTKTICQGTNGLPSGACVDGVLFINGSVTLNSTVDAPIVITVPVSITGDLVVFNATVVLTASAALEVGGCVTINGGSIDIEMDTRQIQDGATATLITSGGQCLSGEFDRVGLIQTIAEPCSITSATPRYTTGSMDLLFTVEKASTEGCDEGNQSLPPGAIAGIVIAAAALAAGVIVASVVGVRHNIRKKESQKMQSKLQQQNAL